MSVFKKGKGFMREGLLKYKELVERKIVMDTIGYTVLIDGFSKIGILEKGVGLLRKMEEGLKPNVVTYTAIIMGFCKKGKLVEGFELFKLVRDLKWMILCMQLWLMFFVGEVIWIIRFIFLPTWRKEVYV